MAEIRAWCERAHLCVRCYLRFAHPRGNANYSGRASALRSRHTYAASVDKPTLTNELSKSCAGCLDALSDSVLDAIPRLVSTALHRVRHDGRYKVTAALPTSVAHVRERALWVALRRDFPKALRPHALREAFKLALADRLSALGLRYAADAPLFVDVGLTHPDSDAECACITARDASVGHRGKRPRAPSTGAVARTLRLLDDTTFCDVVTDSFIPPPPLPKSTDVAVELSVATVLLAGEYCKLSRIISQTPWRVDSAGDPVARSGEPNGAAENGVPAAVEPPRYAVSVEDVVTAGLGALFKPERVTFMAGGREDVDVRCLGAGRPFVVELANPNIVQSLIDADMLRKAADASARASDAVLVKNLRVAEKEHSEEIRQCEGEKRKRYRCVVWTARAFTEKQLKDALEIDGGFLLRQKTPLRVLHRRTLAVRERQIYVARVRRALAPQFFVLDVEAAAGTYIKEFVHGDNGRTVPNVGAVLGCHADILQLDVLGVGKAS